MTSVNVSGLNGVPGFRVAVSGKNGKETGKNEEQVKNGSVFAGNLNNMMPDRIAQKRADARKKATNAIRDQFGSDKKTTDGIKERRDKIAAYKDEMKASNEEGDYYRGLKENLKEAYGIQDDSQEQKDLELIEKAQKGNLEDLSKEELERLGNMGELTEYQTRALQYDEIIEAFDLEAENYKYQIAGESRTIEAIKQGMLTQHGMDDATKRADEIMKAASSEIIGMAFEDAKKHIDEELKKLVEAAKEAAEKKEAEEAKKEEAKADKEVQEELTETIQEGVDEQSIIQQEASEILKKKIILEEDLKGLVVDEQG